MYVRSTVKITEPVHMVEESISRVIHETRVREFG